MRYRWSCCRCAMLSVVLSSVSVAQTPTGTEDLTFTDASSQHQYEALDSKPLHTIGGHQQLAEYIELRKSASRGRGLDAGEDIAHYALKSVGQPYQRKVWMHELGAADCVTFTERCIALGCAGNWTAAHKLQGRLRYREGSGRSGDLNREPLLDWIPNNAWLFDEVTAELGAPLASFEARFEARSAQMNYIAKDAMPSAYAKLQTGDIMFVIADSTNPPSDPDLRTRCVHMAILHKPGQDKNIEMLHSYPPAASSCSLERFFRNPHMRGAKFLRLKRDARQIVQMELAKLTDRFNATAAQLDNESRIRKGEFAFVTPSRAPDSEVVIDGIRYGVIKIRPGETLYGLFKKGWQSVYNLEVNQQLRSRQNLKAEDYQDTAVYVPLSRVNDEKQLPD